MKTELVWEYPLPGSGIGGVAATDELVVVSSRTINDDADIFFILDPVDGALITKHEIQAAGQLDYGNSPRATPVIGPELVYILNAFGQLAAIDPGEGKLRWEKNLVKDFGGRLPTWGYCVSPLLIDNQLIVQPGAVKAAVVSLSASDGSTRWQAASESNIAYASPIVASIRNGNDMEKQVITCDQSGLASWSLQTGRSQWRLKPKEPSEFMVPTPLLAGDQLFWLGELNGLRRYRLPVTNENKEPSLLADDVELADDIQSPVAVGSHVAFVADDLLLINVSKELQVADRFQHKSLDSYALILTESERALVCCTDGTLLLLQVRGGKWQLLAEAQPRPHESRVLAHPAWVNGHLYIRSPRSLACYRVHD